MPRPYSEVVLYRWSILVTELRDARPLALRLEAAAYLAEETQPETEPQPSPEEETTVIDLNTMD